MGGAHEWRAEQFEQQRSHLRAVAYRMLGSVAEAEDAVQETWLRHSQSDNGGVDNLRAWLTTITARVALNMLRARKCRSEVPTATHVPDPLISAADGDDPEKCVLLADSVGLALLVVLDTLAPDERLAFVLHDMFGVPFEEIAPMIDRTPTAARKLASRARRRVRKGAPAPDRDLTRQRELVDAYFAAAHDGDLNRLIAVLDPEVVLRADAGPQRPGASVLMRGPSAIVGRAIAFARLPLERIPVLTNGTIGAVVLSEGQPFSVMSFTIVGSKIVEIDILADPERLREIDLSAVRGEHAMSARPGYGRKPRVAGST